MEHAKAKELLDAERVRVEGLLAQMAASRRGRPDGRQPGR